MKEKGTIEKMIFDLKEYAETRIEIGVLSIQEKVAILFSTISLILIVGLLGIFFLMFVSIALAWLIGNSLHNLPLGFLIVAGFYLFIALLIYFNRKQWIMVPLINAVLKKLNSDEED